MRQRTGPGRHTADREGGPSASRTRAGTAHDAAVANSLALADEAARAGDYRGALSWLGVIEAIGERLPAGYHAKRTAWSASLDGRRPRL